MAMSKRTPGPWQAEPMTGRGAWIKGENGNWAALSCGETDLEAEANARLIAAAPELLAALKSMVERVGPRWFLEQNWAEPLDAIAKAEGRS